MDSNAFDRQEYKTGESGFDYEAFAQEEVATKSSLEEMSAQKDFNKKAEMQKKIGGEAYDWVQCLVAALLFCVIVFSFFTRIIGVIGTSMLPTFHEGDRVLISNLFYEPTQGDVVILRKESFQEEPIIKRVIATEGQTIEIDFTEGIVYVDGVALDEPYIAELTHQQRDFDGKVTVPENCVFVMGDNRNHSLDSRCDAVGFVDERYIIGKVLLRVVPLSDFGVVE